MYQNIFVLIDCGMKRVDTEVKIELILRHEVKSLIMFSPGKVAHEALSIRRHLVPEFQI